MTTKLGIRVGSWSYIDDYPHLFVRNASGIHPLTAYENYVRATGGPTLANYRAGAHRGSYLDYASSWPDTASVGANWQMDVSNGTLEVFTAAGAPSTAQIEARADDLIDFLAANPQVESMVFSHRHEPQGKVTAATWWSEYQNIKTRMESRGVPRWQGSQAGVTSSRGIIWAGPNLAGGAGITEWPLYDEWYPASNSWAWSDDGIQMACFDMYPGGASGSSGNSRWRGLPELAGVATNPQGFIQWYLPKRTQQNNAQRVLLAGIFEWGLDDWNKMWPFSYSNGQASNAVRYFEDNPGSGVNNSPSGWWQSNVNQYPPTFRRALENWAAYLTANPTLFYVICYWDSIADGGIPGSGRGPHMLDAGAPAIIGQAANAGTREENWDAWLAFLRTPLFGHVGSAPSPPTVSSFLPTVGAPGVSVVILGTNLSTATSVRFGGVPASFVANSGTQITATVPASGVDGVISVTTPSGSASSAASFDVVTTPPPSGYKPGTIGANMRSRMG